MGSSGCSPGEPLSAPLGQHSKPSGQPDNLNLPSTNEKNKIGIKPQTL